MVFAERDYAPSSRYAIILTVEFSAITPAIAYAVSIAFRARPAIADISSF
jgi:hypothetical protein